jgi:His-Xaa-Ser system radical SAM maturase HxsC
VIPLSARGQAHRIDGRIVAKIVDGNDRVWPVTARVCNASQLDTATIDADVILCEERLPSETLAGCRSSVVHGVELGHLSTGDVITVDQTGFVRTLYRRASPHNALFATDRCNSRCLMCSQPPRDVQDDWRVDEMLQTITLMDRDAKALGITGGEPTLLGDGFLEVVRACKEQLPMTALHVLSNGRLFRYERLAKAVADIQHHDLMVGIPIYGDNASDHDYIVQAAGAFEDTILGLLNLGRFGVPVEIRIVVHRHTAQQLRDIAEFVYRNLTFTSHVTFMGLEMMGFAVTNLDALWMDPWDYREELAAATVYLADRGVHVSIYNHQLCTLPESVWSFARRSISDWKNEYLPTCADCAHRDSCGGFFTSTVRRRVSRQIKALRSN